MGSKEEQLRGCFPLGRFLDLQSCVVKTPEHKKGLAMLVPTVGRGFAGEDLETVQGHVGHAVWSVQFVPGCGIGEIL